MQTADSFDDSSEEKQIKQEIILKFSVFDFERLEEL